MVEYALMINAMSMPKQTNLIFFLKKFLKMGRITSQPNFYVGQKFQILVGYFYPLGWVQIC